LSNNLYTASAAPLMTAMCAAADRDTLASVGISLSAAARAASAHGTSIKSIAAVVRARASAPSHVAIAPRAPAPIAALPVPAPRPLTKKEARRAAANDMAQRQGLPTDQAAIDDRWTALATKSNAAPLEPMRRAAGGDARQSQDGQAAIDAMHSEIIAKLNKQAGLATPVQDRSS
jgi:hypothetical protein